MNSRFRPLLRPPGRGPSRRRAAALLLGAVFLATPVLCRALPQPSCVFYGEARDEFGAPYLENAEVVLRVEGRECSRFTVLGMIAPGVNFKLPLELDDGVGTPYATYSARPGQTVQISLRTQGQERPIMETRALAAGQPGECIGILVTNGTDADQDGLPDEWERLLIANSGGALTDLAQVRPEEDFDGDGVSNQDEYRAGTYPFLSTDYLYVEETARVLGNRIQLRFLTTRGISYRVLAADRLDGDAEWLPAWFALSEDATPTHQALVGDGYYVSVYLELPAPTRFFRLEAR